MKNTNRTFLLGAGFSKAVANAPVMKEIWACIEDVHEQEKNKYISGEKGGRNRLKGFNLFNNYKIKIEKQAIYGFKVDEIDKVEISIEYLFTLIDLHLTGPKILFKKEAKTKPYDPAISDQELIEAKDYLLTYLYIIFERLKANHLADKFAQIIKENDQIITFNYDLLLEKVLWRFGIWSPLDGYVGVHKFKENEDKKRLEEAKLYSKFKIHKMHGSVNWDSGIVIETDKVGSGGFHFDGLEKILDRPPRFNRLSAGKHIRPWILPSFVKPFKEKEFFEIWQSALKAMSKTDELVIIGYSFRPEDSSAFLLLSMLPEKCNVTLVDLSPEEIKERLEKRGLKIARICISLEDYISERQRSYIF